MKEIVLAILCLMAASAVQAQDSQFWHNHYGTKGVLLGGAVIGSVEDLSAVYYNPGYLGLKKNPGLAFGTAVVDVTFMQVQVDSLLDAPVERTTAERAPGLIAGQISFADDAENFFSYSFLGRQSFNPILQGRAAGSAIDADHVSTLDLRQDLSESWGGVTWSRALQPTLGFGVSLFGAHRFQRHNATVVVDSSFNSGAVTHRSVTESWSFWNVRLLLKLGLYLDDGQFSAGLTVTTPGLSVVGSGESAGTVTVTGGDGESHLIDVSNTGSPAEYHSPLSVGVGAGYRINNIRLHGSVEWFSGVAEYNVITPATPTFGPDAPTLRVADQMRSIVNAGVGIEVTSSSLLSWYASVITDLSTISTSFEEVLGLSYWDILHVNGGAVFEIDDFMITGGLGYAFGVNGERTPMAIQGDIARVYTENASTQWSRLRALVGLTYAP